MTLLPASLIESAGRLEDFLRSQGYPFCYIGGIALQRWGQPRLTRDLDVTLMTGFGNEPQFITSLLERFSPRIAEAAEFAQASRMLLLQDVNDTPIDVSLGAMPYEERAIERASIYRISDTISITTCSAEDLVVMKAFAGRGQDWVDVRSVVKRAERLDTELILSELEPLTQLMDAPDTLEQIHTLLNEAT